MLRDPAERYRADDAPPKAPAPGRAESANVGPEYAWDDTGPACVAWIIDAQRDFLDPKGAHCVFNAASVAEGAAVGAVAALTRAVEWMAAHCQVLVYTGDWHGRSDASAEQARRDAAIANDPSDFPKRSANEGEHERASVIAPIRPLRPVVLVQDADEVEAEAVAYRALAEGRAVFACKSRDGVFEQSVACDSFLRSLEDVLLRPLEVVVAGVARDGSVIRAVDGLLASGREVTVIRDAVCGVQPRLDEELRSRWAGEGVVVSLADLHWSEGADPQISFADIEIAEVYEKLDRMMGRQSAFIPLAELDAAVPWELYRARLDAARLGRMDGPRLRASLLAHDVVAVFKAILLGAIYDLPDEVLEFMAQDRLTFRRFAGLGVTDEVPSARLLRIHRTRWTKSDAMAELVADIENRWRREGYRVDGLRSLAGSSSSVSTKAASSRSQTPGSEPGPRRSPKGGGKTKRASRRKRKKRRKKRR